MTVPAGTIVQDYEHAQPLSHEQHGHLSSSTSVVMVMVAVQQAVSAHGPRPSTIVAGTSGGHSPAHGHWGTAPGHSTVPLLGHF